MHKQATDHSAAADVSPPAPSFVELFTPKLITVFREGYGLADLRTDALAGLTVAIVALPLSMAIAIAAGVTPERGLYTAIVGGFLISALGGSRFQIGGPAGAFIVLMATTVAQHGVDGMLLATMMAGAILLAAGFLRFGAYIKFIPYPVTVGFTAGIAVIIFASQIKDLFGLTLAGPEPGPFLPKLAALAQAAVTLNPATTAVAAATIGVIAGIKRLRPAWPAMLIAVVLAGAVTGLAHLPVETIGTRFGGLPSGLPLPSLPPISPERIRAVLPNAFAFALLGAIESLLSAVVADGMTGRRHRSNCELVAQGVANIASGLFGGICVTGTIARTATNVRSGARGPVAGILHAAFLLIFVLIAAPLANYIPLAALAGVLAFVAWNMVERPAFGALLRASRGDAIVLLSTFLITVFRDLTEGILVGFTIGVLLFLNRMSQAVSIDMHVPLMPADRADGGNVRYDPSLASNPDVVVYRISGAFFFGSASTVGAVLSRMAARPKTMVFDFSAAPLIDSTAADTIAGVTRQAERRGAAVILTGVAPAVRRVLEAHGLKTPAVQFENTIDDALARVHTA